MRGILGEIEDEDGADDELSSSRGEDRVYIHRVRLQH